MLRCQESFCEVNPHILKDEQNQKRLHGSQKLLKGYERCEKKSTIFFFTLNEIKLHFNKHERILGNKIWLTKQSKSLQLLNAVTREGMLCMRF